MRRLPFLLLTWTCLLASAAPVAPAETPAPALCRLTAQDMETALKAANAWRQAAHPCGGQPFEAAAPLRWSEPLQRSAERFALELAERGELSHQGRSSPTLRERARDAGYLLRAVGENLAAGPLGLEEVFALWTSSADHCANLMRPDFEDLGVACVNGAGRYERFWVMHLGAPARRP